jgi:hypothetical protein
MTTTSPPAAAPAAVAASATAATPAPAATPVSAASKSPPPALDTGLLLEDDVQDSWRDESNTNILEDYLETIMVLPAEMRRSLSLLRELDAKCAKDLKSLGRLQEAHVDCRKRQADETTISASVATVRKRVEQLLDEKNSIAQQLTDLGKRNVARLNRDLQKLEGILRTTGDLVEDAVTQQTPGTLVAAFNETQGDAVWILARVVEWLPFKRVVVSDADNDDAQFTIASHLIVALVEDDDVASARARIGQKGKEVMAIYPETTSFYPAQVAGTAFRAGIEHGPALANKICVTVTFFDDEDASGNLPRRHVQALYVFVK